MTESGFASRSLEHPALVYHDLDEFLGATVPFLKGALEQRQPAFVAVGPAELDALRSAVGDEGVGWADTKRWFPEPAKRLRAFHRYIVEATRGGATRIRLIGEPLWPTGPPEFSREWARYESALNAILEPYPVSLICTYDATRLDPAIIEDAHRTHPAVGGDLGWHLSAMFEDPSALLARWNPPLAPVPRSAAGLTDPTDLSSARAFVRERATEAGLVAERAEDLALAVSEVLANASLYGGGGIVLRTWVSDPYFLCQIDDGGRGPADTLAGYRPPGDDQESGRGLWLARQVLDLLQIVSGPSGTAVRLHLALQ